MSLLGATGASVIVEPPVAWTWTDDLRPCAVPSRLWRLPNSEALRPVEAGVHLWWSGPRRTFELADRSQRLRLYEIDLREGRPVDIEGIVDGLLLCDAWSDLVLPAKLRGAWAPLIVTPGGLTVRQA